MLLTTVLLAGNGLGIRESEMDYIEHKKLIRARIAAQFENNSLPTKLIAFAAYESAACITRAKKDTLKSKREYEEAKLIQEVLIDYGITTELVLDCGTDHFSELKITITKPKYDKLGNKRYTKKEINITIDESESIKSKPSITTLSSLFYINPDMCD